VPSRTVRPIAGFVYHVTTRCHAGVTLFDSPTAYGAFVDLIAEAQTVRPMRLLAYCVMPNHAHFVLWPETDDAVERFMGWVSMTHAKRYHRWNGTSGPVYPKRYEAVSVQTGFGLYRVIRYVERNPCAARLASRPDAWRWSSASSDSPVRLAEWPVPRPPDWRTYVATAIESAELEEIRRHLKTMPLRRLRRRKNDDYDW
jgi:REP-associated tyrosine transposase